MVQWHEEYIHVALDMEQQDWASLELKKGINMATVKNKVPKSVQSSVTVRWQQHHIQIFNSWIGAYWKITKHN